MRYCDDPLCPDGAQRDLGDFASRAPFEMRGGLIAGNGSLASF